ncbi:MAG: hypothetical protein DELT_03266 [Desulfovibrio sp.]
MRDHLHRFPKVFPLPLLGQHVPIDLACRKVGEFIEILVDKPLIVPEVKVRLCAVFRHENFPMLEGAHSARIHIDIWIELLGCNLKAARFQKPSE